METFFTVHAVVLHEGKILVLQRAEGRTGAGKWNCVTGYVQDRESAEAGALRELQEETGLAGAIVRTAEPYWVDDDASGRRMVVVASLISVEDVAALRIDERESQAFRWIALDDPLIGASRGLSGSVRALGLLQ